ncbi:MAG TPA: hypothetical protein DEH25_16235 [Chloroflexi bacterium]|nr:hypothetical protein [Chloroflexota bacterium]
MSDVKVIVAPETVIIGEINIGNLVEVEGVTEPEGWLRASEIHLREYEILGVVEALSNPVWVVSGLEVQISPETQIDPKIQIGSQVKVLLHANDDGSRYAVWILFVTPSPTATPTPTLTATLQPTHTPIFIELNQDGERDDSKQETPSIEETDKPEEIDKKDDSEDSDDSEDKGGEEHEGGEEDGGGE